jgi:hypothetical protein
MHAQPSFLKVALLGLLTLALAPGYAAAAGQGQDLSEMLASSAAVQATAVSGPILSVSPLAHDYGVQDNGTNTIFVFTVSNIGDQTLHYGPTTTSDPAFFAGSASGTIPPGGSIGFGVVFHPTDGQSHSGTMTVPSDGGTVVVGLQGQANAAPSIVSPGDKTVAAFTTLSFTVVATDADDTQDDALTYSMASNLPPGPTFDTSTGAFVELPVDTDAAPTRRRSGAGWPPDRRRLRRSRSR